MKSAAANKEDVAGLHEHLQLLLLKFNGGIHFLETMKGISVREIKSTTVNASLTPFAKDMDGNYQCIDNNSGHVVTWDSADGEQSEDLQMNLG